MRNYIAIVAVMFSLTARAESLQEQFFKANNSKPARAQDKSRTHEQVDNEKHGIVKATVEHTACFGSCPEFSISVTINGDVEYIGRRNVPFIGIRKGKVDSWYVHNLFHFIHDSKYFDFQNVYTRPITDHPHTYTQVVKSNGASKIIQNYANSAPTALWAIEETIESTGMKAVWEEPKPAAH